MAEDAVEGVSGVMDVRNEVRVGQAHDVGMAQGTMPGLILAMAAPLRS